MSLDYSSSCFLHPLPTDWHRRPLLPPPPTVHTQWSAHYPLDWRSQAPQPTHHTSAFAPSTWTNVGSSSQPASLWPAGPPEFLLPFHHYQPTEYASTSYSVARSDTSSAISRDSDLSPSPEVAEVVCNAPLVAPIPLPYHSPTFLLYDLPDDDEDLSHPPYTHRPHKRKRTREEEEQEEEDGMLTGQDGNPSLAKRRSIAEGADHWDTAYHRNLKQWAITAAPPAALRHAPSSTSSRRHRGR